MFVVSLWGVNCRFWSHFRCLGLKAIIYLHSQVSLSTVRKEIYKLFPDTAHTEISLRGQFKFEPHPHWFPLEV